MEDFSTAENHSGEVCIKLKGLTPNQTIIQVDNIFNPHTNSRLGYNATVQLNNGGSAYSRNVFLAEDIDLSELGIGDSTEATLVLSKAQNGAKYDYIFNVINSHEVAQGFSIISIAVIAHPKSASLPDPEPPSDGCYDYYGEWMCVDPLAEPAPDNSINQQYSLQMNTFSTLNLDDGVMLGTETMSEALECNDSNRSLTPAPFRGDGSGVEMNVNQILRNERAWATKNAASGVTMGTGGLMKALAANHLRLFQNHRSNALYDVKSDLSIWDGDMEFGNFLYGAVLRAHGFPEDLSLRYAAAYKAWQDYRNGAGSSNAVGAIAQGIVNFITNTGDSEGDQALISRGYHYAKEVWEKNKNDLRAMSCVDHETLQSISGSGGPSFPGDDPDYGGGTGGSGTIYWSGSCELWQFPDGNNGHYYMYRNCSYDYWMQP
ncbi:MAG: hypothetical protein LAT53_09560 [Idiomarina sp.]|nr:hypothetical protein [Idiomarina sp.]